MAPIASSVEVSGEIASQTEVIKEESKLLFVKLSEHASAPTKGSKYAAGYDLKSAYDVIVPKRGSVLVKTYIQIQLPEGTYGRVAPRSGLALKNKIDVVAGVIDQDYRGNIGVILFNHSDEDFDVAKGDRIAQLICEKIVYPEAVEVENLDVTERGVDGFGSTGVKKAKLDMEVEVPVATEMEVVTVTSPKKVSDVNADVKVLSPQKQETFTIEWI